MALCYLEDIRQLLRLFLGNILFDLLDECARRLYKVLDVLLIHIDNAVVIAIVAQLLQTGVDFVFLQSEDASLDVMEVEQIAGSAVCAYRKSIAGEQCLYRMEKCVI